MMAMWQKMTPVILWTVAAMSTQLSTATSAPIGLEAPEWFLVLFAGIALAFWIMEKLGKLPTAKQKRDEAGALLAYRGEDGIERYLKHVHWARETHEIVRALATNEARIIELLERVEEGQRGCVLVQREYQKKVDR